MLKRLIRNRARFIYNNHIVIIIAATIATVVSIFFAKNLGLKTDIANLLPRSYQSVRTLDEIKNRVGGVGSLIVALKGNDFELLKTLVRSLASKIEGSQYVNSVEFEKDRRFLDDNALIYASLTQLNQLEQTITDRISQAKLRASGLYVDLFEDGEADTDLTALHDRYGADKETFYTNGDHTVVGMRVYPAGTAGQLSFVRLLFEDVQQIIDEADLESYDPDIEVLYSGSFKSSIDENDTIISDMILNLYTTVPAIILFVSFYFRQLGGFVFIFVPLAMSICWTFGLTDIVYGDLNAITAFLFVILFGLGIDYGIHSFARYLEERGRGEAIFTALEKTVVKTGRGILTGAITTSVAFFTLMINDFKGFSQFGFIAGVGVIFAYFTMTVVFPAFLVAFDRLGWVRHKRAVPDGPAVRKVFPFAGPVALASAALLALSAGAAWSSRNADQGVDFEYDFKELKSNLKSSADMKRKLRGVFDIDGDSSPAIVLSDSKESSAEIRRYFLDLIKNSEPRTRLIASLKRAEENLGEVANAPGKHKGMWSGLDEHLDEVERSVAAMKQSEEPYKIGSRIEQWLEDLAGVKEHMSGNGAVPPTAGQFAALSQSARRIRESIPEPTVKSVLTLHSVVPDSQEQKMAVLARIDSVLTSGDIALVSGEEREAFETLRSLLDKRRRISLSDLPEKMLERFVGKDGALGEFVFIVPAVKLRDGRQAIRFAADVENIELPSGKVFHASSSNIVIADMLQVLLRESKIAVSCSLLAVFGLVWLDVKRLGVALLVLTPLLAALLWTIGLMYLFGIKFNFFNMVVIPSVIGIGIDNGVHIYHRYIEEGKGSLLTVQQTTGVPVAASVFTTMLGFLGLVLAQHNGLNSIGTLAMIGLSMTLLAALVSMPALLQLMENRKMSHSGQLYE